jgi:hypothetical protein
MQEEVKRTDRKINGLYITHLLQEHIEKDEYSEMMLS